MESYSFDLILSSSSGDLNQTLKNTKKILDSITIKGEESKKSLADFADIGVGAFGILSSAIGSVAGGLAGLVKNNLGNAIQKFDEMNQGVPAIKDSFDGIHEEITKGLVNVIGALDKGMQDAGFGSIADVFIKIQGIVADVFGKIIEFIPPVIQTFSDFIGFIQENASVIIPIISGLATAFVALGVISKIVTLFSTIQVIFGLIASPIGIAALAIGALVAIGIALYQNWDTVKAVMLSIWQAICEYAVTIWNSIAEFFIRLWATITTGIQTTWTAISSFFINLWASISTNIITTWNTILQFLKSSWSSISTLASDIWTSIANFFIQILKNLSATISAIWSGIQMMISAAIQAVFQVITSVLSNIASSWSNIWTTMKNFVTSAWNGIQSGVEQAIESIYNTITGWFSTFKETGANLVGMIADGITSGISKAKDAIENVVGAIRDFLPFSPAKTGPLSDLDQLNFGGTISTGIYNGQSEINRAMNRVMDMPTLGNLNGTISSKQSLMLEDNLSHTMKQQAIFTINLGKQKYRAFVDDISQAMGEGAELNLQF